MSTPARFREWLSPLVYLSNNWLSLIGIVVVTTAVVLWLFLLPTTLGNEIGNPYIGILVFLLLPVAFFLGLALIPLGIVLRRRRERRAGAYPASFPSLDLRNVEFRRLLTFIALTTFVNVVIASQVTYSAVSYMDSVSFCGQTCHTVMKPEFVGHQTSVHSNVECVKCHIGPGAEWFVRSKFAGIHQLFGVAFNNYPRPIATPVRNLRAGRETCGACHALNTSTPDRLRVFTRFAEDETNSMTKTVLMIHAGGGDSGSGIHGAHLGRGVRIRYAASDERRQTIPWVERSDSSGRKSLYLAAGTKADAARGLAVREMDCIDCHNRPSHTFELPERGLDRALLAGSISPQLPFVRKQSLEILKKHYATTAEAASQIPAAIENYYRQTYPAIYLQRRGEIQRSAQEVLAVFNRNVFPEMRVDWGTYPNNSGHTDYPGCFRCHDDQHLTAGGQKISQDCGSCHNLVAMEEPAPKILSDLGIAGGAH